MDTQTFRLNEPQVVADTVDDEVLAINMSTGAYFNLKGWSAYAWTLITSGTGVTDIHQHLISIVDGIDAATLRSFVDELIRHGLVAPADNPSAHGNPSPLPTPPAVPFDGLAVEAHTDMADLILLDPVHDVDAEHGWPTPPPS